MNDAGAISEAERSFRARDASSETGFMLRSPGPRLSGDRIVHNYIKKIVAFEPIGANTPVKGQETPLAATILPPQMATAVGEKVTAIPLCIGFD